MAATEPLRLTTPLASTYDQGTDVQPAVSWANPNKDAYPTTSSTTTTNTTATTYKPAAPTPTSTTTALEKNLNPTDKEDPRMQTKALPFPNSDSADIAASVVTPAVNDAPLQSSLSALHLHNGNILDRTMDQIRGWVQSFQQRSSDEYEEYSEELNDQHPTKGTGTVDAAKAKLNDLAQQTSSTFQQVSSVASDKATAMSSTVRAQAGELQNRMGDVANTVSDRANATVQQVKSTVNDFIASHQSQPGESIGSTISHNLSQQLPSQAVVKEKVSAIIPPLAQQASSSSAFLGSFVQQYLATYRDFLLALRRQSLPLQAMTAALFITHFVLPFFFFEKGPARSVIYCYVLASLLSHLLPVRAPALHVPRPPRLRAHAHITDTARGLRGGVSRANAGGHGVRRRQHFEGAC